MKKNKVGYVFVLIDPDSSGTIKIDSTGKNLEKETDRSTFFNFIYAFSIKVIDHELVRKELLEIFEDDLVPEKEGFLTTNLNTVISKMISLREAYGVDADREVSEEEDHCCGFDEFGVHEDTNTKYNLYGLDAQGFNSTGFNKEGINKYTGTKYDLKGFDKEGFDINGFNLIKIHKVTHTYFNLEGYNIDGYDRNGFDANHIHQDTLTDRDLKGFSFAEYHMNDVIPPKPVVKEEIMSSETILATANNMSYSQYPHKKSESFFDKFMKLFK